MIIHFSDAEVTLTLDDTSSTKQFISPVHDVLDLKLTTMSLGGSREKVTTPDGASLIKGTHHGHSKIWRLNTTFAILMYI